MLGPEIYRRIESPEFRPYTMVLASGERIEIGHRDSVSLNSVEAKGRRFFASSVNVLQTLDDQVIERVISLPMIAQIVDVLPMNGHGGPNGTNGKH